MVICGPRSRPHVACVKRPWTLAHVIGVSALLSKCEFLYHSLLVGDKVETVVEGLE